MNSHAWPAAAAVPQSLPVRVTAERGREIPDVRAPRLPGRTRASSWSWCSGSSWIPGQWTSPCTTACMAWRANPCTAHHTRHPLPPAWRHSGVRVAGLTAATPMRRWCQWLHSLVSWYPALTLAVPATAAPCCVLEYPNGPRPHWQRFREIGSDRDTHPAITLAATAVSAYGPPRCCRYSTYNVQRDFTRGALLADRAAIYFKMLPANGLQNGALADPFRPPTRAGMKLVPACGDRKTERRGVAPCGTGGAPQGDAIAISHECATGTAYPKCPKALLIVFVSGWFLYE